MLRYRNLTRLRRVLLFKDSEGGTWPFELADFKRSCICRHAPLKKTDRSALIVPWNSPLNNNSVPPLARPLNLVGPRDFDRVGRAPSRPTFQSFRIADCGLRIADLAQRSATGLPLDHYMIWKQFRIAERGYGISDSQISEPLAILLQAAEILN
jgi:hypothetical protein